MTTANASFTSLGAGHRAAQGAALDQRPLHRGRRVHEMSLFNNVMDSKRG